MRIENFENESQTTKKQIILDLRDAVSVLVENHSLHIKENQISSYVKNILVERHITYTDGEWYKLFKENQKRNYSIPLTQGNNHKHNWKMMMKDSQRGTWESCSCGDNKINGIIQQAALQKTEELKAVRVSEIVTPKSPEYELLEHMETITANNLKMIKLIKQRTSINNSKIDKQQSSKARITKDERLEKINQNVNRRINIFNSEIQNFVKTKKIPTVINELKSVIIKQLWAIKGLDDRATLTTFEKVMANFAVSIGYDQNDIARFLLITAKHMKNNVMSDTHEPLLFLEWFGRCPNPKCGIMLKDYVESQITKYKKDTKVLPQDHIPDGMLEPLITTSYQNQVLELKKEKIKHIEKIDKLKTMLEQIKDKMKSKKVTP